MKMKPSTRLFVTAILFLIGIAFLIHLIVGYRVTNEHANVLISYVIGFALFTSAGLTMVAIWLDIDIENWNTPGR